MKNWCQFVKLSTRWTRSRENWVYFFLRSSIPMAAAERLQKMMILPIFDHYDVAWHGCGEVNADALEKQQHRAAKLSFPNSGLNTKNLNATLGLVPLINRRELRINLLTRKCLDGSAPPYLRTFAPIATAYRYCARKFTCHASSVRAKQ